MTLCKYANIGESEIMVAEKISILMMRSSVVQYSKVRENASQGRQAEGLTITASTTQCKHTNQGTRVYGLSSFCLSNDSLVVVSEEDKRPCDYDPCVPNSLPHYNKIGRQKSLCLTFPARNSNAKIKRNHSSKHTL